MAITATVLGQTGNLSGATVTTLAVNPTTVGDAMVFTIITVDPTIKAASLSGGGADTWVKVGDFTAGGNCIVFFLARVKTTGSQTITITYSAAPGTILMECFCGQLADGVPRQWSVPITGTPISNSSSTTVTYPAIVAPVTGGNCEYIGFGALQQGATNTTVGGFTQTAGLLLGTGFLYGVVAINSGSNQPVITSGSTPAGTSDGFGVIVQVAIDPTPPRQLNVLRM